MYMPSQIHFYIRSKIKFKYKQIVPHVVLSIDCLLFNPQQKYFVHIQDSRNFKSIKIYMAYRNKGEMGQTGKRSLEKKGKLCRDKECIPLQAFYCVIVDIANTIIL